MKRILWPFAIAVLAGCSMLHAADASKESAPAADQDQETCRKNLKQIYDAVQSYRRENKDIPNWLSDLVPKHLADAEVLLCPVAKRTGQTPSGFASDPKLKTSYGYQFRPAELGNVWAGGSITYREWKRRQMGILGGEVPLLRCYLHGQRVLNLAFNGRIYESGMSWENEFADVVNPEDFAPERLAAREKHESKASDATDKSSDATSALDPNASPAEQYRALTREFEAAQREFNRLYQAAKTDADRQNIATKNYPQPQKYAGRFLEIAEKHPKDSVALDALVWVVQNARAGRENDKALEILVRDHIQSAKLGAVCQNLAYSPSPNTEKILREILEKNTEREVQGQATFSLALYLKEGRGRFTGAKSKVGEAEKLFEQVVEKFADLKHWRGSLADAAKGQLNEIRNLAVEKVAPEIEGEDPDGVKFKLSDYRGKVVMIDFWGDW